jgi:hypothetical protein
VTDPVRLQRLIDQEGHRLLQATRRGTGSAIRLRRAMVLARPIYGYLRWRNANPATPISSPPSAANAPGYVANATAGGGPPHHPGRLIKHRQHLWSQH